MSFWKNLKEENAKLKAAAERRKTEKKRARQKLESQKLKTIIIKSSNSPTKQETLWEQIKNLDYDDVMYFIWFLMIAGFALYLTFQGSGSATGKVQRVFIINKE